MDLKKPGPIAVICLLLLTSTLLVYWPVKHHDFTNFDDDNYITQNSHVSSGLNAANVHWAFTTYHASNWHPLTWLSHMLDCQLYGLNPAGPHLTNLALHVLNTLILFGLLSQVTGQIGKSGIISAIFALHPLHVESVAWVAERKDVLSTLFFLLTISCYAAYVRTKDVASAAGNRSPTFKALAIYVSSLFLFALGLLSKPMVVTLPCVLLLIDWWPLQRLGFFPKWSTKGAISLLVEKIPFFALSAASCILTYHAQEHGGAVMTLDSLSFEDRVTNALVSYCRYLGKIFWPRNLSAFYPYAKEWPLLDFLGAVILVGGLTVFVCIQARRRGYLLFGWLWFVGMLVPVIGLVQVGLQSMADRYMYAPMIGLSVAVTWGVADLVARFKIPQAIITSAVAVLLGLCFCITQLQVLVWANSHTLFEHSLAITQDNFVAQHNLALADATQARFRSAIDHFQKAIILKPDFARVHNNLGFTYYTIGQIDNAIAQYREALRLQSDVAQAHNNLANALMKKGETQEALEHYAAAIKLNLDFAEIHYDYANALVSVGNLDEAGHQFSEALRINPTFAAADNNWGVALINAGRVEEGAAHCAAAAKSRPKYSEASYNLGTALLKLNKPKEAADAFRQALRYHPTLASAHFGLGLALLQQGEKDIAASEFESTLKEDPNNSDAHEQLASMFTEEGKWELAEKHIRAALDKKPSDPIMRCRLATILTNSGRIPEGIDEYRKIIQESPNLTEPMNNLAWLLASNSNPKLRDGPEAVRLAKRACELTNYKEPMLIGTLAAAYAEAGQFTEAVATAEKARSIAEATGLKEIARRNGELVQLYRSGKPYHEPDNSSAKE